MLRKLLNLTSRFGVLFLALSLTMAGCMSNPSSSLGPEQTEQVFSPLRLSDSNDTAPATRVINRTTRISAANGGDMAIFGTVNGVDYIYRLRFPAGALNEDTDIRMTVDDQNLALLSLNPHGIQFNVPVTLALALRDSASTFSQYSGSVDIYWLNEQYPVADGSGNWVPLSANVSADGNTLRARVQLEHFSQYGLGGYRPFP